MGKGSERSREAALKADMEAPSKLRRFKAYDAGQRVRWTCRQQGPPRSKFSVATHRPKFNHTLFPHAHIVHIFTCCALVSLSVCTQQSASRSLLSYSAKGLRASRITRRQHTLQRIIEKATEVQVDTLQPARAATNTVSVVLPFAHFLQVMGPKLNSMARNF